MSGKNVNFTDKNIQKVSFYKNRKVIKIDNIDANNIFISKEEPYGSKNSLKLLLDTMMMVLSFRHAFSFHK